MVRKLVCAVVLSLSAVGCSGDGLPPNDTAGAADQIIGDALPKVDPYEFNGPDVLLGWRRDPELEGSADFTRLASALPRQVRARLTEVKAGYYRKPGSKRIIDRFFYVEGRLGGEKAGTVVQEIAGIIEGYQRRTVTASPATFDEPVIRRVLVDFGLAAFDNPFRDGAPVPTTCGSLVWTDGRTLRLLTVQPGSLSTLLETSKKIQDQRPGRA